MTFIFDLAIVFIFFILNILVYHKNIINNNTNNIILLLLSYLLLFFLIFFYSKNNNNLLLFSIIFLSCLSSILFLPKIFDKKIINYLQNSQVSSAIFFVTSTTLLVILSITLLVLISFSMQIKENIVINKQQYLTQIKENPLLNNSHNSHLAIQKFYLKENLPTKINHRDNIYIETKKISINLPFFNHHELLILAICLVITLTPLALYK